MSVDVSEPMALGRASRERLKDAESITTAHLSLLLEMSEQELQRYIPVWLEIARNPSNAQSWRIDAREMIAGARALLDEGDAASAMTTAAYEGVGE